jgi:hypothetical protein
MNLDIRVHALERCAERFGKRGDDAVVFITRLYNEARYIGSGQGRTHVLRHPLAHLVVEYLPDSVRIVTLMPPDYRVGLQLVHPDPEPSEQDVWRDYWARWDASDARRKRG